MSVARRLCAAFAAGAIGLGGVVRAGVSAPVVINDQTRSVQVSATAALNNPTNGGAPVSNSDQQSQSAPDQGPFNPTVHANASATPPGSTSAITASAQATQNSSISASAFVNSGKASGGGQADSIYSFNSLYSVSFTAQQAITFTLAANVTTSEYSLNNFNSTVVLKNLDTGMAVLDLKPTPTVGGAAGGIDTGFTLTQNPLLSPGKYQFSFEVGDASDNAAATSYSMRADLSAAAGPPSSSSAVPLPAAFWPGVFTLAVSLLLLLQKQSGPARL